MKSKTPKLTAQQKAQILGDEKLIQQGEAVLLALQYFQRGKSLLSGLDIALQSLLDDVPTPNTQIRGKLNAARLLVALLQVTSSKVPSTTQESFPAMLRSGKFG